MQDLGQIDIIEHGGHPMIKASVLDTISSNWPRLRRLELPPLAGHPDKVVNLFNAMDSLEIIAIHLDEISIDVLAKMVEKFGDTLSHLCIRGWYTGNYRDDGESEDDLAALANAKQLHTLWFHMDYAPEINERYFESVSRLSVLNHLHLNLGFYFSGMHLIPNVFHQTGFQLSKLRLSSDIWGHSDAILQAICHGQQKLEVLSLSIFDSDTGGTHYDLSPLAMLHNLRCLALFDIVVDDFLSLPKTWKPDLNFLMLHCGKLPLVLEHVKQRYPAAFVTNGVCEHFVRFPCSLRPTCQLCQPCRTKMVSADDHCCLF